MASSAVVIDTALVKLASRCNLDCDYCYVYKMGNDGWRSQPKRMSGPVAQAAARRLRDLCLRQAAPLSVVFHGGEPLLVGAERFASLCATFRDALPSSCGLHLQTNGVLLSDEMLDVCARHDIGISISLDGPALLNDRHRPDHAGRGSHARVTQAIERLRAHPRSRVLFTGVLAVVDLASDPTEVYAALKLTGAPSIDLLYRDGNHDALPPGKADASSTEYGDWMCRLLEVYLADRHPVPVRFLDDMLKLLLGGRSRKEGVGLEAYGIVVIETDGSIRKNDTLKSAHGSADGFIRQWSVMTDEISDIAMSDEFTAYHDAQRPTCTTCASCPDLGVCGGGMPAHRWRTANGFSNPSVFCADQRKLIDAMRMRLSRHRLVA